MTTQLKNFIFRGLSNNRGSSVVAARLNIETNHRTRWLIISLRKHTVIVGNNVTHYLIMLYTRHLLFWAALPPAWTFRWKDLLKIVFVMRSSFLLYYFLFMFRGSIFLNWTLLLKFIVSFLFCYWQFLNKVFLRIFCSIFHALVVARTHHRILLASPLPLQPLAHSYLFSIQSFLVACAGLVVWKIYHVSSNSNRFFTLNNFFFTILN